MGKLYKLTYILVPFISMGVGCSDDTNTEDVDDTDTEVAHTETGDTDTDTNTDTGTDTDTETEGSGTGVWYDEIMGLFWQDPPSGHTMDWSTAVSYCDNLDHDGHTDWRLPNIDELISLIRGCQDGTSTEDLSLSYCEMMAEGCAQTDSCVEHTSCDYCAFDTGPGELGCYWDPALNGACDHYWSLSSYAYYVAGYGWGAGFNSGYVHTLKKDDIYPARCVRDGP